MENLCKREEQEEEFEINSIDDIINILKINNIPKYIIDKIYDKYITREDKDILLNPKKNIYYYKKKTKK